VLFGAVLSAEDGQISVGTRSIVMENAVIRGRVRHPTVIGDDVLVGPHAHVNGARVGDGCFLATGAALFPGCVAGAGSEVRIHGVVHGITRDTPTAERMARQSAWFAAHLGDRFVDNNASRRDD
jgi:carbonic anhydrase/acetyltransferase-like protein (isoleucine patch superfamily)